jgi:plasmid replication initiation protein
MNVSDTDGGAADRIEWPETALSECNVNMSNSLVRAAQSLKLSEKRIVSRAIAKSDSKELRKLAAALAPNAGWKVRLSAEEYAETFDILRQNAYVQLKEGAEALLHRYVRTKEQTRRGEKERQYRWTSGNVYHHGEGWVELNFTPEVAPFLLGLRREFTAYKLKHTPALRSIYAWRLMELFAQFKGTGLVRIDFDDFCHVMEAPPSTVKDYAQLRRRVIEPAVKELQGKDGLDIEWEARKEGGRKVTSFEFRFKPNPQLFLL